jgi:hypothetical protein
VPYPPTGSSNSRVSDGGCGGIEHPGVAREENLVDAVFWIILAVVILAIIAVLVVLRRRRSGGVVAVNRRRTP